MEPDLLARAEGGRGHCGGGGGVRGRGCRGGRGGRCGGDVGVGDVVERAVGRDEVDARVLRMAIQKTLKIAQKWPQKDS